MFVVTRIVMPFAALTISLCGATDLSDTKISPTKGKQGQSFPIAIYSANCGRQIDQPRITLHDAIVDVTGADLELKLDLAKEDCVRQGTIKIHDDAAPGDVQLLVKATSSSPSIVIPFTIQDKNAGPVPPGIKPAVDVQWDVLDYSITRDNFGKRVAESFYAIQVVIGNDSGYALQLASLGFVPRSISTLTFAQQTLPNSSYVIARGVLEEGQVLSARNEVDRYLQGTAILLAGFTPFFKNTGHRATYAAAVAVFGNPLLQSFEKIFPDKTITELKRLDDFTLRDGVVIANNTQVRTIVFFQKNLVRGMVSLTQQQLRVGLQSGPGNIAAVSTILDRLAATVNVASAIDVKRAQETARKAATNNQDAARTLQTQIENLLNSQRPENSQLSPSDALELQIANLRLLRFVNMDVKNIEKLIEPLLVRWELQRLVLIGDQVAFINRVRVDSSAPQVGVSPPLTVDENTTPSEVTPGVKTNLIITGDHLNGAIVSPADSTLPITLEKGATDVNGKFITEVVTVDQAFKGTEFTLLISAPGLGGAKSVKVKVAVPASTPAIQSIKASPDPLPQSGGTVIVTGNDLTDVQVFVGDKKLDVTDAKPDGFVATIPAQATAEITLTIKTPDGVTTIKTQKLTLSTTPLVREINPATLAKAGGDVTVKGDNLSGVQAFIDSTKLALKDATASGFKATIPAQTASEITITFKTADGTNVQAPQKLTLTN